MNQIQNLIKEISIKIQFNIDGLNKAFAKIGVKADFTEFYKGVLKKILFLEDNIETLLEINDFETISNELLDIYKILNDKDMEMVDFTFSVQKFCLERDNLIHSSLKNLESVVRGIFQVSDCDEITDYFSYFADGDIDKEDLIEVLKYYKDLV